MTLNITNNGGNIYCAALLPSVSVKTVVDIQQRGVRTIAQVGQTNATLLLTGLSPSTTYNVMCYSDDFSTHVMTIEDALLTSVPVTTSCCRSLVLGNVPNNIVQYFTTSIRAENYYSIGLDSMPTSKVDVALSIVQVKCAKSSAALTPSDVVVLPSSFSFLPSSVSYQGSFVIRTTVIGCYALTARATGVDGFKSTNTSVEVWSFRSPPVVPVLSSVQFSNRGTSLMFIFDTLTDRGADKLVNFSASFKCANLVDFVGANATSCKWVDNSTVEASFLSSPLRPSIAESATLLGGIVKAACVDKTVCSAYLFVPKTVLKIAPPPSPLVPTPVLLTLSTIALCDDIALDPTPSRGTAGRDWTKVAWSVSAQGLAKNGSDIEKFLKSKFASSTSSIVVIPNRYLTPSSQYASSTYEFTLSLTNFLGQTAIVRQSVLVGNGIGAVLPQIRLYGAGTTLYRWKPLTLSATASFPTCIQDTSKLPLYFSWKVYDGLTFLSDAKSIATDQKIFKLNAYSLDASKVYTVSVDVSFSPGGIASKSLGYASGKLIFGESGVSAVITGGSPRVFSTDDVMKLDASGSTDIDYPDLSSALTFKWACQQYLPVFGASCPGFQASTSSALTLPAGALTAGLTYNMSVTVTNDAGRIGTAYVLVQVSQAPVPEMFISVTKAKYNVEDKLVLSGQINSVLSKASALWTTSSIPSFATSTFYSSPLSKSLPQGVSTFQLLLAASAFTPGLSYTFQLQCNYVGSVTKAISEVTILMNEAPVGGLLRVLPATGTALSTVYDIRTTDWNDDESDFPLSFLMSYYLLDPTKLNVLKSLDTIPFVASTLGQGLYSMDYVVYCVVFVQDIYSGRASTTASTIVRPATSTAEVVSTTNAALSSAVSNLDATSIVTAVNAALNSINSVACTVPTPCSTLNREQCQNTQRTCGECLAGYAGAPGDANSPCYDATQLRRIGASCALNSTCITGSCVRGACADVSKTCVDDCSGYGRCVFVDSLGTAIPKCSITDSSCVAKCVCVAERYGSTCALRETAYKQQIEFRTTLCVAIYKSLKLQDVTADVIKARALSISNVLVDIDQISDQALGNCSAALVTTVLSNPALSCAGGGLSLVSDALSKILSRGHDLPSGLLDDLISAITALTTGCLEDFVIGEPPRTVENFNMRMLSTVLDTESFSETVYHPPESAIELLNDNPKPSVNLNSFEGSESDTLALSIVVFKNNPRGVKSNSSRLALDLRKTHIASARSTFSSRSAFGSSFGTEARRLTSDDSLPVVGFTLVLQNVEPVDYDNTHVSHLTFRCYRPFQDEPYQLSGTCPNGHELTYVCPSNTKRTYNVSCPAHITSPSCTTFDGTGYSISDACEVVAFTPHNTTCFCRTADTASRRSLQASTGLQEFSTVVSAYGTQYVETITDAPFLTAVKQNTAILSVFGAILFIYVAGAVGCFAWERYQVNVKDSAKKDTVKVIAVKKVRTVNNFFDALFPDEFRSGLWYERVWNQMKLEHLLLRPFAPCRYTAESVEHWTIAMGAFMIIVFVNCIVARLMYSDDGRCEDIIDQGDCESFQTVGSFLKACSWRLDNEACEYHKPSASFYNTIVLTLIAAVFTAPLDALWYWCVRNVAEFVRHRRLQVTVYVDDSALQLRSKNDEFCDATTVRSKIMRAARLTRIQRVADSVTPNEETRTIDRRLAEETLKATFRTFHDVASTADMSRIRYGLSRASYTAIERTVMRARVDAAQLRRELEALDDREKQETHLLKKFIADIYDGYERSVIQRYFFPTDYLDPTRSTSQYVKAQHWLSLILLPAFVIMMLYFISAYNLSIGSRASNLWLLVCLVSVLQKVFFSEPFKVLAKWMVINAHVAEDVREFCEALSKRSMLVLRRTNGVVHNYNDMVQHFNPACRTARMFPALPISRLLLSINDSDIKLRVRPPTLLLKAHHYVATSIFTIARLPDVFFELSLEYGAIAVIDFTFIALFFANGVSPILMALLVVFIVALCLYPCRAELRFLWSWCLTSVRTELAIQPAPHNFDFDDEPSFAPPVVTKASKSRTEKENTVSTRVSTFKEMVSIKLKSGQLRIAKRRAYPFQHFSALREMNRRYGVSQLLDKDVEQLSAIADEDDNESAERLGDFSDKKFLYIAEEKSSFEDASSLAASKQGRHHMRVIPENSYIEPIGVSDDLDVQSVLSWDSPNHDGVSHFQQWSSQAEDQLDSYDSDGGNTKRSGAAAFRQGSRASKHTTHSNRMKVSLAPQDLGLGTSPLSATAHEVSVTSSFLTVPHSPNGMLAASAFIFNEADSVTHASTNPHTPPRSLSPAPRNLRSVPHHIAQLTSNRPARYTDVPTACPGGTTALESIEEIKKSQTGVASPPFPASKQNHTPAYFPRKLSKRQRKRQRLSQSSVDSNFVGPGRILIAHELNELPSFPLMY